MIALLILGGLTLWSFEDPHADVPVISKIVCSMKGGTFTDGSPALGIAAGCYKVESNPVS